MAHFAQIDDNNIVQQVIVVADADCAGGQLPTSEPAGQAFIASLGLEGTWVQTSYNNNFRRRYATIGGSYNRERELFIDPQPYPSWTLDYNFEWQPPVPMPATQENVAWVWNEEILYWVGVDVTPPATEGTE